MPVVKAEGARESTCRKLGPKLAVDLAYVMTATPHHERSDVVRWGVGRRGVARYYTGFENCSRFVRRNNFFSKSLHDFRV